MVFFFFFKQKTAYEMRISDWSSDVCSSDLAPGDERAHAVVDAPAGENDFRIVADLLGLGGQIIGVDADAVAADQPRREGQEVPLGAGGGEHVAGGDLHALEDDRQLVHQRDVQVADRKSTRLNSSH